MHCARAGSHRKHGNGGTNGVLSHYRRERAKIHRAIARISGRMRRFHIKVIPGDRVTIAVSPYDPTHGLIVHRG
jgi:translation initiation factor IF-1